MIKNKGGNTRNEAIDLCDDDDEDVKPVITNSQRNRRQRFGNAPMLPEMSRLNTDSSSLIGINFLCFDLYFIRPSFFFFFV